MGGCKGRGDWLSLSCAPQPAARIAKRYKNTTSHLVASCATRPLHPARSLGHYATEEGAARAYDVVAAWRNRQIAAQLEERTGAAPRRARSEAITEDGQARKRAMVQLLPLNLQDSAPPADATRLQAGKEDLLTSVRGKSLARLTMVCWQQSVA